jgi:hypothetical protein
LVVTGSGIFLLLLADKISRIREMDDQIARLWRLAFGQSAGTVS